MQWGLIGWQAKGGCATGFLGMVEIGGRRRRGPAESLPLPLRSLIAGQNVGSAGRAMSPLPGPVGPGVGGLPQAGHTSGDSPGREGAGQ